MKMRTKTLNKTNVINNINGLSEGDTAYCGPYGTVTCTKSAAYIGGIVIPGSRRFKVSSSTKLRNGGNWTMKSLRKAICG